MKILVVSTHPTHPTIEGNRKFILNQVELFRRMGHTVYFLLIQELNNSFFNSTEETISIMRQEWGDKLFVYKSSFFQQKIRGRIETYRKLFNNGYIKCDDYYPNRLTNFVNRINDSYRFDCCIVNYYTYSKLLDKINIPLKALTTHDVFSYKNILTGEKQVWQGTTADQEAIAMQRSPHIFALNSEESIYFSKLSPNSQIYNVYSIFTYKSSPIINNKNILFLSGNNVYNQNGLNWFLKDIFPLITEAFPEVKLIIGGGICKCIQNLKSHNIILQGFICDEEAFYSQGDIVINPTYQGTGLKIKTFEAISYDKVTMAHPHSAKGIFSPMESPLFVSNEGKEWVDFLSKIWSDKEIIRRIKKINYNYMENMSCFIEQEYKRFFNSLK